MLPACYILDIAYKGIIIISHPFRDVKGFCKKKSGEGARGRGRATAPNKKGDENDGRGTKKRQPPPDYAILHRGNCTK